MTDSSAAASHVDEPAAPPLPAPSPLPPASNNVEPPRPLLSDADPALGAVLLLFFGSGCAALIYEVVWLQLLQLLVGSDAVAIGVLLATYMGGLCLGSLLLPRMISTARHPLRVYAVLELLIGIFGLAIIFGLPGADRLATSHYASELYGRWMRAALGAMVLLPPTFLMGATLPALSRWVRATPAGVAWMGYFYGGNIVGAVVGALFAGFVLLPNLNMTLATIVAATINGLVFAGALVVASGAPFTLARDLPRADPAAALPRSPGWVLVMFAIALSGMTALGGEAIWTRMLALSMGGTVYTFSIILAVFLLGLGIGTSAASSMTARNRHPRAALALCQIGLILAIYWASYALCISIPSWPIDLKLNSSFDVVFPIDVMRCLWAVLPAAVLWGASFPFALAAVTSPGQDPGKSVGAVYAANTLGAIAGALFFSIWLVPHYGSHEPIGTQKAHQFMICITAAAAVLALAAGVMAAGEKDAVSFTFNFPRVAATFGLVLILGMLIPLRSVPAIPEELIAFGREMTSRTYDHPSERIEYAAEGMNSSVAVSSSGNTRYFHVSGKTEASTDAADMRLQRMLGHIPSLLHVGDPHTVLVVGCGAGVTAGTFTVYPSISHIDICELEPLIPKLANDHFRNENYGVVENPIVGIHYDDARHFVLTTNNTYDIITSDPIHPWVKGSAILYTREYFQMCKDHLNPGGIVTQWVPLYESNLDAVRCELRTFFDVFPDGIVWGNDDGGAGYDVVVMGRVGPATIDPDAIDAKLDLPEYQKVRVSLAETGFDAAADLMLTYAGRGHDLNTWLTAGDHAADVNTDDNLRLQYLAGWSLNANPKDADSIYQAMLHYRQFPADLIGGSVQTTARLKKLMFPPPPIQPLFGAQ